MQIKRRKTIPVTVGTVGIGGDHPIRIQSMTNTATADVDSTVEQIVQLAQSGSELVRFTVKDNDDARAVARIRDRVRAQGLDVPLVGDFHFNGHVLLDKFPDAAEALDKYRINPGNVGSGTRHDKNFAQMIDIACKYDKPVRIGVNMGSLDQGVLTRLMDQNTALPSSQQKSAEHITLDAMVVSALESAKTAERLGLGADKIIISTKVSRVPEMIHCYRSIAAQCSYPLHLGVTEAGLGNKGVVCSTAGLSVLLHEGIGDTIRVSLTPAVGKPRTEEVQVAQLVLQLNGIRQFTPTVTSCPGCGRTTSTLFQTLAEQVTEYLQEKTPEWKRRGYKGVENMTVAVMGCVVNGPGESKDASVGLSLPGTGEDPVSPVYINGKRIQKLQGEARLDTFKAIIDEYVEKEYGPSS